MDRLVVTVKEIKGNCPVYGVGDRIVLDIFIKNPQI